MYSSTVVFKYEVEESIMIKYVTLPKTNKF